MTRSRRRSEQRATVFVYGTLREPGRAAAVLDDWGYGGDAVLRGLHRVDGTYPTLAPGGSVDGRLLRTGDLDRLDDYEGVDEGLYVRVAVPTVGDGFGVKDGSPGAAFVYVGEPDRIGVSVAWPGEGSFLERVRRFVEEGDVTVSLVD